MRRIPETNRFSYLQRQAYVNILQTLSLKSLPPFQRSWHLKGEDSYSSFMAVSNTSNRIMKGRLRFVDQENVSKWCDGHWVIITLPMSVVTDSVVKDATLKKVIGVSPSARAAGQRYTQQSTVWCAYYSLSSNTSYRCYG